MYLIEKTNWFGNRIRQHKTEYQKKKKKCKNFCAHPSDLPHCPGREEMHANSLPPPNCSSICASSVRPCWRFSSFLATWLLFFVSFSLSSVFPSPSCLLIWWILLLLIKLNKSKLRGEKMTLCSRKSTLLTAHKFPVHKQIIIRVPYMRILKKKNTPY